MSLPYETDDDPQGEPSEQVFSAPRGEVPEALQDEMIDSPFPTPPRPAIGDIWEVTICPDGRGDQGGPVTVGAGFSSWDNGVTMNGMLLPGAASIEVTAGGEAIPVRMKEGLFLAAIPKGMDVAVIFRGSQGQVLEEQRYDGDWLSGP